MTSQGSAWKNQPGTLFTKFQQSSLKKRTYTVSHYPIVFEVLLYTCKLNWIMHSSIVSSNIWLGLTTLTFPIFSHPSCSESLGMKAALKPPWKGPHKVPLTTDTAEKPEGIQTWVHTSQQGGPHLVSDTVQMLEISESNA